MDNNATTAVAPQVRAAVLPILEQVFGNPSSSHVVGQQASYAVLTARRQIAQALNAAPDEIIFTSGGTESDNLALRGALAAQPGKSHMIVSAVEHEAVAHVAEALTAAGIDVTCLPVDQSGQLDLDQLQTTMRDDTALVSVMLANNETGILLPVAEISALCKARGVWMHTDAVQAMGKMPIDVHRLGVDLLSLSAHKFHGLKGTGILYQRRGIAVQPQILGGNQESSFRSGTENVAGIVAMGAAAELVSREDKDTHQRMRQLRDDTESALLKQIGDMTVVGRSGPRLPNTSYLLIPGTHTQELLIGLSEAGICASGGAACHSGALQSSNVLTKMGFPQQQTTGVLRVSLSRYTTTADVDHLIGVLPQLVRDLRSRSAAGLK